jgi:probable rRNA maturation factor
MIRRRTRIILDALMSPDAELSIVLVNDLQIAALNQEFLQRTGPTNVIAFPMQAGRFTGLSPNLMGDVVISMDTADREARSAGLSLDERVTQLLIHGILHLIGYDHELGPSEARRMSAKSRRLLAKIRAAEI